MKNASVSLSCSGHWKGTPLVARMKYLQYPPGCDSISPIHYNELPDENIECDGLAFVYRDASFLPGESYIYRVDVEKDGGRIFIFQTELITPPAGTLALHQNHPNPFNPGTTIRYYLPRRCRVELVVYDLTGAEVRRLVDAELEAGPQQATWNGMNDSGKPVSSGLYFYRITAGKERASRKMLLLR